MMFDLSPHIKLSKQENSAFKKMRVLAYLVYFAILSFAGYWLLFPSQHLNYNFNNPGSLQNTLVIDDSNRGILAFDAPYIGNYSEAEVTFVANDDSLANKQISAAKTYRSFLLPVGSPLGFPDGSLVKNNNSFYIISGGEKRIFGSPDQMKKLGFSSDNFLEVAGREIDQNAAGKPVDDQYPDGTIFKISDEYYQLKNAHLRPFVSERAFLTHNRKSDAIEKPVDFLNTLEISDEIIGFSDGSLIANSQSVFAVANEVPEINFFI